MKTKKGTKKILKVAVGIILIMLLMVMINFYPTLNLNSSSMSIYSGEWIDVYYENEETAAADVFEYADGETKEIALKLGFKEKQDVRIFIYDSQKNMQEKNMALLVQCSDWIGILEITSERM